MKALVIGGNRFFGKRLVHQLLADGTQVTVLNRGNTVDDFGDRVQRIHLDRQTLRHDHPALEDFNWDIVYDQVCYDANEAQGACEAFHGRAGLYVFTSSLSVYRSGAAIQESSFDPKSYRFDEIISSEQNYSEGKRQAEAVFFSKAAFPVIAVRFPIVLGPDDYTKRLLFHITCVKEQRPIFFPNIDAKISFIQSADAASFLASLVGAKDSGPINCGSPDPISLRSMMEMIEQQAGMRACFASSIKEGEHSPFGVQSDWYMDTTKLIQSGYYKPKQLKTWLPILLSELDKQLTKQNDKGVP